MASEDADGRLELAESIAFAFVTAMPKTAALSFVRSARSSLADAEFLQGFRVNEGERTVVSARLPVHTQFFGRRELPFTSELKAARSGAELKALSAEHPGRGWAEVSGRATVSELGEKEWNEPSSRIEYELHVRVHLLLPAVERWGGRALLKMVELTGASVLRSLASQFPAAVESAARRAAGAGLQNSSH